MSCHLVAASRIWYTPPELPVFSSVMGVVTSSTRARQFVANQRLWALAVRNLFLRRGDPVECNLCGYHGTFLPAGDPPRKNAMCKQCGSGERQRLVGLWLNKDGMQGGSLVHFAAERGLGNIFRPRVDLYQTADIDPSRGDLRLDIENIDLPDETVDFVVASHVLEHVDDVKALTEIRRILTSRGRAILLVPIIEGWERTYENPDVVTPEGRTKHFGQSDHVRFYGRDFRDRVTKAGFALEEYTAEEPDVSRYGLLRGDKVFIASKV